MSGPDQSAPATPTVLVHGFGTSAHLWRRVRAERPADLTTDLIGFGTAADAGHAGQTTGDMADGLARDLRSIGRPVRLVGHSMGGKVVLLTAARYPELVASLVLIAPSPPTPEPMDDQGRRDLRGAHGDAQALRRQYRDATRLPVPQPDFEALVEDGLRANPDAWVAWPDVGSREDIRAEVAGLTLPITVLYSADDPAIAPGTIEEHVLKLFSQAKARRIGGSGHLIPLEDPQAVADLLEETP